jgi:hypothetical protein
MPAHATGGEPQRRMVSFHCRLPRTLVSWLAIKAQDSGQTVSQLVRGRLLEVMYADLYNTKPVREGGTPTSGGSDRKGESYAVEMLHRPR